MNKFDDVEIAEWSWAYLNATGQDKDWTPRRKTRRVTGPGTFAVNPLDDILEADCTAGAVTFELETCVGCDGRQHTFKKIDSSSNAMTIDAAGSETIDGAATNSTTVQYITFWLKSRGVTGWWSVILQSGAAPGGAGTVTSVGLTMPTDVFNVAGSPVATAGTLAVTFDNQSANTFFAGPASGGAATPAFRGPLVTADYTNASVTYPKIQDVSAISKLLGRGSAAGAGDVEEITLGTNLTMSGTTLNATGATPAGNDTEVQFNDGGVFGADADFTWAKTTNIMTLGSTGTPATIIAHAGVTDAAGAALAIKAGAGVASGVTQRDGGHLTITGGTGADGTNGGDGGDITITGGTGGNGTNDGNGGNIFLVGGVHGSPATQGSGGSISLTGGASAGAIEGGDINITAGGNGGVSGNGGEVNITSGAGNLAGNIEIVAADGVSTNGQGGAVNITAGDSLSNGAGPSVTITAGTAGGSGGAIVTGDVKLRPGLPGGGVGHGAVILGPGATANGQAVNFKILTQLVTIAAAATTSSTIQIPANALAIAVSVRVTVAIPTATVFDYGISGATTRYGTGIAVAVNTTHPGTDDAIRYYAAGTAILITPDATPANNNGRVRVTIHYLDVTPPTS